MSDFLSWVVFQVLDDLGYSECIRRYRVERYTVDNSVAGIGSECFGGLQIVSGSAIEGSSRWIGSDIDVLHIQHGVIATDCIKRHSPRGNQTVLFMDDKGTHPGYSKLKLLSLGKWAHFEDKWNECFVYRPGNGWYLSSTEVLKEFHKHCKGVYISGPASTSVKPGMKDKDFVFAVQCSHVPIRLRPWFHRRRVHNWPTSNLIAQVWKSEFYLVPVGIKESTDKDIEWRLSFNTAERILVHSFNPTQFKVYILCKMIVKQGIQVRLPHSLTSYIVKTLMFWTIEQTNQNIWIEKNMLTLAMFVINRMLWCITNMNCPNYFIPQNNLLQDRVTQVTQPMLCDLLLALLHEGGSCVLRFDRIGEAVIRRLCPRVFRNEYNRNAEDKFNIDFGVIKNVIYRCNCLTAEMLGVCTFPAVEILADTVLSTSCRERKEKEMSKFIFKRLLQYFAFRDFAFEMENLAENRRSYRGIRKSVITLYNSRKTDRMSGEVTLALAHIWLGQTDKALSILTHTLQEDRSYIRKVSVRQEMNKRGWRKQYEPLLYLLKSCDVSVTEMIERYTALDMVFKPSAEVCLPKALQFELHRVFDNEDVEVKIDSFVLAHYLRCFCYLDLGQKVKVDKSLSMLEGYATGRELDTEYKETVLNILGYHYIQKKMYDKAAKYLIESIMLQRQYPEVEELKYNIAVWHLGMLLTKLIERW